jgi:transcriptional regulator with XRE-family HTH domain
LTDARVSRGAPQADLAGRLGCPQSTVSKVECGERRSAVIGNALHGEKRRRTRGASR